MAQRLEDAFPDRARHRYGELRALAAVLSEAFAAEIAAIERSRELVPLLLRQASRAANTHNPHSKETGRFVPRVQGKAPELREASAGSRKKRAVERK